MQDYDLVIIGGGLVGGSLACALRGSGLRIAVVEAATPAHPTPGAAPPPAQYDERVIALSLGSRRIFDGIGIWPAMAGASEPIRQVHVSDRGHCGFAHLDAADEGVEALGYVTPARAIGMAIEGCLQGADGVELLRPARLAGLHVEPHHADLEVAVDGVSRLLRTRLVVAADGGDSGVRKRLKLGVHDRPYGYAAIISTVTPAQPRPGVAYERFTDSGPLAMLPMTEGRWSVVWTAHERDVPAILTLDDDAFLAELGRRFGARLGRLERPARRIAYPLRLTLAKQITRPRVALVGNAAHTLHPVAGQGFNLGLRDVAELADLLVDAHVTGRDPGGPAVLNGYRQRRQGDQRSVALATDTLARVFVNPFPPLRAARDLGMLALDVCPTARHALARRFMGLHGRLPRLARGLAAAAR
ncbi:MAG: 2-octaprenyl-6-methoxyphenyl hydroxylase [Thiohalocapsa sp.]|jgi:2-octaprenyl-6-methoxyphenol hydroxylase|uniref:2-octaprenyl-6-methoxyphenyl hydroxylase n=1 Tax=Thiohalocapsa sp. TaxID=2497641 RepID=UPI0025EB5117|nr:2-octaprenyl-6-methoxyphenyl hydroxylase [Thiohalocapsa sp.]MCG6942282.1 2-octaprenyl-6-methoxyphenyl hydroxylase [Thiohalocapsa sp.]